MKLVNVHVAHCMVYFAFHMTLYINLMLRGSDIIFFPLERFSGLISIPESDDDGKQV